MSEIYVSVSWPKKQGGIAPRLSAECVTSGITYRMGLGLNDAPTEPASIGIMDRDFACQLDSIHREFRSTDTPKTGNGNRLAHLFHFTLRHCGVPAMRCS